MKGKVALITGASRGIGKQIALNLAKKGANIIINDLGSKDEESDKLLKEFKEIGVEAIYAPADVSDYDAVEKMIETVKEKFDKVDILINNAGITKDRTLKKMSKDEWYKVIDVNLNSVFNVTKHVLQIMPEGGRIINLSSIVGLGGNFGQTNYSATKAGVIGFTKSLSKELGKKKITVNAIAPGFIKSAMTDKMPIMVVDQILELIPMKAMGSLDDVANLAAFLASNEAGYITGQVIRIDGGLQM